MKLSAKAKRIRRHQRRGKHQSKLNLVSLMDIFTILVFFLMVNSSSDVQVLSQDKTISLPVSNAEQIPKDTLALTVTNTHVLINGRAIVETATLRDLEGDIEPKLKEELDYQASRSNYDGEQGRPVTIVADKELPYQLLKKIMSTCVDSGYLNISLAVNRKADQEA